MEKLDIAVLGLGRMGSAIAQRLIAAGHRVTVYNRSPGPAEALAATGAKRAAHPGEAVTPGGIALTMLANDAAVEAVTGAFLDRLGPGGIHLSMSTIAPSLAAALAERHRAQGSTYLGAPVFGRPEAAEAGKLWIALSGDAAAKARIAPVLEATAQGVFDFGEKPEAALVVKIAGNFLITAALEAMAESFALLEKNGVDPRGFHELVSQTLFACPIYKNYGGFILDRKFSPPGFTMELGAKDIGLVLANGGETRTPVPLASLLRDRFLAGMAKGRGDLDWCAVALNAVEDAGLPAE